MCGELKSIRIREIGIVCVRACVWEGGKEEFLMEELLPCEPVEKCTQGRFE